MARPAEPNVSLGSWSCYGNKLGTGFDNQYTLAMIKSMERFTRIMLAALLCVALNLFADKPATDSDADKAWSDLQAATRPTAPKSWEGKQQTDNEKKDYYRPLFLKAADLAKDFYTKYPDDKRAAQAKFYEMRALNMADQMGATNATARLHKLEENKLADPNSSEEEKLQIKFAEVRRKAQGKGEFGTPEFNTELEKGVRELQKEFPKRPEPWQLLVQIAGFSDAAHGKELLTEVVNGSAPDEIKAQAKAQLGKMDRVGKPLDLNFKAVDGRDVDLSKMKGKVVLIDFWATWCGPCVAELPHVKAAYDELHSKGFEIVGISLDNDKSKLTKFTAEKKMEWPQYFDGKQWENEISTKYGIQSIPAMWLVDKKGNLRDINARDDLKGKVEKLLAE
jgi:thiol-disulfide isomerase/thioredoxin